MAEKEISEKISVENKKFGLTQLSTTRLASYLSELEKRIEELQMAYLLNDDKEHIESLELDVLKNPTPSIDKPKEPKDCDHLNTKTLAQQIITKWHCNICGKDFFEIRGDKFDIIPLSADTGILLQKEREKLCEHEWKLDEKVEDYDYSVDKLVGINHIFICLKCAEIKKVYVKF